MTGGDGAEAAGKAAAAGMENARREPVNKGPKLRRPNDPPARYGPLEEEFTVEINYGGFFCGFGAAKSYVDGKKARFDGCEADTWSPLWLYDFMEQLGYPDRAKYSLYWLLPGQDLGSGLRIVDRDTDTMHMISVVPKFQYFQMFVDHKDMNFADDVVIDDVVISGSPILPPVMSPISTNQKAEATSHYGHEVRRSRRKIDVEEEAQNGSDDDSDSDLDEDWVDSDNELAADDDDLFEEWVDEKFEAEKKKKTKWEQDSDYETDADLEELPGSDIEEAESAEEVEVVDKPPAAATQEQAPAAAKQGQAPAAAQDQAPQLELVVLSDEPEPILVVFPDDEHEPEDAPPMKLALRRKGGAKKKILHQVATSATASIVESAMSYNVTSSSVIQVLQEQAIATQQSQTSEPAPLPECQFIASCRDELPPPRPPTTKTLGLKKRKKKQQVPKKKENQVPDP